MIVEHHSPFATLMFSSRDPQQRDFYVVVLRGTFRIEPNAPLRLDAEQHPIVETDVFHADPHASSLFLEGDLAPFKPRSDIQIHAVAHAPGGWATPHWLVRARVGSIEKTLRVTGPRRWVKGDGGTWELTEPEPCVEVPV